MFFSSFAYDNILHNNVYGTSVEDDFSYEDYQEFLKWKESQTGKLTTQAISEKAIDCVVYIEAGSDESMDRVGTGFFVSSGLVMTNYHVIAEQSNVQGTTFEKVELDFEGIYWYDINQDLVLLKTKDYISTKWLNFETMNEPQIGDKVVTIGNPLGLSWSVSEGIVSSFRENEFLGSTFIQTDTTVTNGSSGGPLLNSYGNVVGVIASGINQENINFAIQPEGVIEILEAYTDAGHENTLLVSEQDFLLSVNEKNQVAQYVYDYVKSLIQRDKSLYMSLLHPNYPNMVEEEKAFDAIEDAEGLEELNYSVVDLEIKKYGDTIMLDCMIRFIATSGESMEAKLVSRMKIDPQDKKYKFIGNIFVFSEQSNEYNEPPQTVNDEQNNTQSVDASTQDPVQHKPVVVTPKQGFTYQIDFVPSDVVFDLKQGSVYLVDPSTKSIAKYHIQSNKLTSVRLDYIPDKLVLDNGKLYVTQGIKEHQYTWDDQQGYIGVIDANTMKVIKYININLDPYDIAASNGYIYVSSGSDQWTEIFCVSESSGLVVSTSRIRHRSNIEMHPWKDRLYTIDTDSSPRDMKVYSIKENTFLESYDSVYHGDYDMEERFKLSPDGKFIFNYSGHIFRTGYGRKNDIQYYNKLSHQYQSIAFDSQSNMFYISQSNSNIIYAYDYTSLQSRGEYTTLGTVEYMAAGSSRIITIERIEGMYGIHFVSK